MGTEPPYTYQRPSKYTVTGQVCKGFSPKSVTQASWAPQAPRPAKEGPLIDAKEFNKHPDSYLVVPYGNLDWKPMNKNTKTKIKWIRWFQLFLRVCSLLAALGLLFCVICIRPLGTSLDWIIRIAPAIGVLHTLYAIHHSCSSKNRTPISTASYMVFAAIMDAGILPFLAFTAMMAYEEHTENPSAKTQWQTLFQKQTQTWIVIYSFFLTSVVDGALHLTSFMISVYLAVVFRKISKLPPDMNPLESNLTSRNKPHKRNKSSISQVTEATSNRNSAQSLMDYSRKVPFMHTREMSSNNLSGTSLHCSSAINNRNSQADFQRTGYDGSPRASQIDFAAMAYPSSGPGRPVWTGPSSARSSRTDLQRSPNRSPKRSSGLTNPYAHDLNRSNPSLPGSRPVSSTAGHMKRSSLYHTAPAENNWLSGAGETDIYAENGYNHDDSGLQPPELQHLRSSREQTPELVMTPELRLPKPQKAGYEFMDEQSENTSRRGGRNRRADKGHRLLQPLGMNPVSLADRSYTPAYTPAPTAAEKGEAPGANPYRIDSSERRALREVAGNDNETRDHGLDSMEFMPSKVRAGTPSSYRRGGGHDYLEVGEGEGDGPTGTSGRGKTRFYGSLKGIIAGRKKGGRAVSSGLDEGLVAGDRLRGRDVSGKIAEEGRA